jgi:hypothetical protein
MAVGTAGLGHGSRVRNCGRARGSSSGYCTTFDHMGNSTRGVGGGGGGGWGGGGQ